MEPPGRDVRWNAGNFLSVTEELDYGCRWMLGTGNQGALDDVTVLTGLLQRLFIVRGDEEAAFVGVEGDGGCLPAWKEVGCVGFVTDADCNVVAFTWRGTNESCKKLIRRYKQGRIFVS